MSFPLLLAIAGAGGLGAVARYLLVLAVQTAWPGMPLGVAIVNVLGCFGFGCCWALAADRWSPTIAAAVLVGFFGAFTTFSSFAADCHTLWTDGRLTAWAINLVGQNVAGLLAVVAGVAVGEALAR